MNDDQLRREFERFGVVKSARVITNRSNNKSKGNGFVEMPHRKEALIAIKALDNSEVMTRRIRVNEARANTKPPWPPCRRSSAPSANAWMAAKTRTWEKSLR